LALVLQVHVEHGHREGDFFYVTGHGVPAGLLAELAEASRSCVTSPS
jgi:hypothetical protein